MCMLINRVMVTSSYHWADTDPQAESYNRKQERDESPPVVCRRRAPWAGNCICDGWRTSKGWSLFFFLTDCAGSTSNNSKKRDVHTPKWWVVLQGWSMNVLLKPYFIIFHCCVALNVARTDVARCVGLGENRTCNCTIARTWSATLTFK